MIVNSDLHIHGLYSGATSEKMTPRVIAQQAPLKGLDIVGTGDILNRKWERRLREELIVREDGFEYENGTFFLLQAEVEDLRRVHHIIIFPSLSKVEEVRERIGNKGNLDSDGRPKLRMEAPEIADVAISAGCLIGPSHAFTPWTAIFKEYNSVRECYADLSDKVSFIELGLSADTDMADRISELHRFSFLTNSDAHSPWPNKLGREFNVFSVEEKSFDEVRMAIQMNKGRRSLMNVGLDPREGKYHKTRCIGCKIFFDLADAVSHKWRCPICNSVIKKGVADRINELADLKRPIHPEFRPKYVHIIPLSEIIAISFSVKNVYSSRVQSIWKNFVERFGSEINVLINAEIDQLMEIDEKVGEMIKLFRDNKFSYIPGGGGVYGIPVPPGKKAEIKIWRNGKIERVRLDIDNFQRKLGEFV